MIIVLDRRITKREFEMAREVYKDYIKTVIDIKKNILAVGGEYHIDCEEVLVKMGSSQKDLFGGGYRISTKQVEYMAMSNYKPAYGHTSYEILDRKVRRKLEVLTKKFLEI